VLITEEKEKLSNSNEPEYGTGHRSNANNVIRAIKTDNVTLLRKCFKDKQKVHDLNQPWGQPVADDSYFSPLQLVTMKESETLLKEFYPNFPASKLGVTYGTQLTELYAQRKNVRQPLLQKIQTGNVSHKAYGARIRAVEMTRGNRQGNNAFAVTT
jgi:hypothetical protein